MDGQIRFQNGYVWTWKLLNPEIDSCGFILYPDTWGRGGGGVGGSGGWGLNERLDGLPHCEPLLSGIQACCQASQRAYPSQVHQYKLCK